MGWTRIAILIVLSAAAVCGASPLPAAPTAAPQTELRDIRGALPPPPLPPFSLTGGVLLLAGLTVILTRSRHRQTGRPTSPSGTAENLNNRLANLTAAYGLGHCHPETLFIQLDSLIRAALASRTGLMADRLTTDELLSRAAACDLVSQELLLAGQLLHLCDLVKFAAHRPETNRITKALAETDELLRSLTAGKSP